MTSRQVRSLDQRIADTRRELEALEAKKRVREDAALKWLASVVRRLDCLCELGGRDNADRDLRNASNRLELYMQKATQAEEASP